MGRSEFLSRCLLLGFTTDRSMEPSMGVRLIQHEFGKQTTGGTFWRTARLWVLLYPEEYPVNRVRELRVPAHHYVDIPFDVALNYIMENFT